MKATTALALLGGLAVLTAGAEGLVRGASRLRSYAMDYGVAATAAAFPWILVAA